ncbi:MAG: hypothetical protein QW035_01060 [Candidatus Anstonellales archaeon]
MVFQEAQQGKKALHYPEMWEEICKRSAIFEVKVADLKSFFNLIEEELVDRDFSPFEAKTRATQEIKQPLLEAIRKVYEEGGQWGALVNEVNKLNLPVKFSFDLVEKDRKTVAVFKIEVDQEKLTEKYGPPKEERKKEEKKKEEKPGDQSPKTIPEYYKDIYEANDI